MNARDADFEAAARLTLHTAAQLLVDAALRVVESDPHSFGTRPCTSCRTVSALVGRPFGCDRVRASKAAAAGTPAAAAGPTGTERR